MMEYFGLSEEAKAISDAVDWTLNNGFVTKDIDPVNSYFTSTVGELVSNYISNDIPQHANIRNMALGQTTII
jgi:3-isopropylmalate dehydrogenase